MFIKLLKAVVSVVNRILYRVEYINEDKLPVNGPAILVSNHQHTFDVLLIHAKVRPWIYWVSKKELTEKFLIGPLVMKFGAIPVDRMKNDLSAAKKMLDVIKRGDILGIFPQGTRIKNSDMLASVIPKTGAVHFSLRTGVPIIPIGIKGDYKLFGKMQVVAGDWILPETLREMYEGDDSLMRQTIHVMKEIYALAGVDYQITPDAA